MPPKKTSEPPTTIEMMEEEREVRRPWKRACYVRQDILGNARRPEIELWERDDPISMASYHREILLGEAAYKELARRAGKELPADWCIGKDHELTKRLLKPRPQKALQNESFTLKPNSNRNSRARVAAVAERDG